MQKAPSPELVNVGDLHRNSCECQGGSREHVVAGSPNFVSLRQTSHEGTSMLLGHPPDCNALLALRTKGILNFSAFGLSSS